MNYSDNNQNQRIEPRGFVSQTIFFSLMIIMMGVANVAAWGVFQEKKDILYPLFIIDFVAFILFAYSCYYEIDSDEKWAKQNQDDIAKATFNLKQELLMTKTDLNLAQNKIREFEDKDKL